MFAKTHNFVFSQHKIKKIFIFLSNIFYSLWKHSGSKRKSNSDVKNHILECQTSKNQIITIKTLNIAEMNLKQKYIFLKLLSLKNFDLISTCNSLPKALVICCVVSADAKRCMIWRSCFLPFRMDKR
jgi:hypothetical protein